jgi:hypothetical protein
MVVLELGGLTIVVSLSGTGTVTGGLTIVVLLGAGVAGAMNMKYAIKSAATITNIAMTIAVVEYALASSPLVIKSSPMRIEVTPDGALLSAYAFASSAVTKIMCHRLRRRPNPARGRAE